MEKTKLGKHTVCYTNKEEYHIVKNEIFNSDIYFFNIQEEGVKILDIGAHIGLSVIYFKDLFPKCSIQAYEPNPKVFEILKENIFLNGFNNVDVYRNAVWTDEGKKDLHFDNTGSMWFSTSSFLPNSWKGSQKTSSVQVNCITLSSLLNEKYDIVKIDVEGVEEKILREAKEKLSNVQNIVIEYHPVKGNSLDNILNILKDNGFKIEVFEEGKVVKKKNRNVLSIIKGIRN